LPYACFTAPEELRAARAVAVAPVPGDPEDYVALEGGQGQRVAVTLTCAANAIGQVPEGDFARGEAESARSAVEALGEAVGRTGPAAAEAVVGTAAEKAARAVEALLSGRGMDRETTDLVAGGGGASALAPAVGAMVGLPVRLAPNAPVVSAIGTALAVVRDVVERTVPEATEEEVLQVRREAAEAAIRAGADPDSITVDVEYDPQSAVLRAVATGQTELRERDPSRAIVSDEERRAAAAKSLRAAADRLESVADSGALRAFRAVKERRLLFGLLTVREEWVALVDQQGVVRLVLARGRAQSWEAGSVRERLGAVVGEHTRYGDAGAELPQVFLGVRARIVNLSGLPNAGQVLSLAEAEIAGLAADESVMAVVAPRRA
jgi:hypothetical protein